MLEADAEARSGPPSGLCRRVRANPNARPGDLASCQLHAGAPPVVDAHVVVAAVEAERPELAVAVTHAGDGARILVRIGVEDVLGADRQRDIVEREADLEIDERFAGVQRIQVRHGVAQLRARVLAIPVRAVVVQTGHEGPVVLGLVDPDVPARPGQPQRQRRDAVRVEMLRAELGDRSVGVVEDAAERRPSADSQRGPGRDDVDSLCPRREVIHEEAERRQVASLRNPGGNQRRFFVGCEGVVPRNREPVVYVDAEVVRRERESATVDHRSDGVVDRLFRLQRRAVPQRRDRGGRRDRAVVDQVTDFVIELGCHVQHVLLAGRRGAEPAADAGAHRERVGEGVPTGQLAVHRGAEAVVEVLDADGGAKAPLVVDPVHVDVAVHRDVAAIPDAGILGTGAAVAVRGGAEALRSERTYRPRRRITRSEFVLLVPPLGAAGDVDHVAGRV